MSMTDDHKSSCTCSSCVHTNHLRLALGLDKTENHRKLEAERDQLRARIAELEADRDKALQWIRELLYAVGLLGGTRLRAEWLAECRQFLERER